MPSVGLHLDSHLGRGTLPATKMNPSTMCRPAFITIYHAMRQWDDDNNNTDIVTYLIQRAYHNYTAGIASGYGLDDRGVGV
jgi:hypothetical protein